MEHGYYPWNFPAGDGFMRFTALLPKSAEGRILSIAFIFMVLVGGFAWTIWLHPQRVGVTEESELQKILQVASLIVLAGIFLTTLLLLLIVYSSAGKLFDKQVATTTGDDDIIKKEVRPSESSSAALCPAIKRHLRSRYGLFWHGRVRILWVAGEPADIDLLVPALQKNRWLEGNRTVLIYGGSLTAETDPELLAALRKLRRGRPLDAVVRVIGHQQPLTPQVSDGDLRGLERIGEHLRYQPPVWLWQLCSSNWPQAGGMAQTVAVKLPPRATARDVQAQFSRLIAPLRRQGIARIVENSAGDFLLRLAQQLAQGGSGRWKTRLSPWLYTSQRRVPLRGVVFSLPESVHKEEGAFSGVLSHAVTLPPAWRGLLDDCARVRGRRVGMPRERALGLMLLLATGVWGSGMLVSFTLNRAQIVAVADKARALAQTQTTASLEAQLTALHALRNDAGRLQHRIDRGAPWYQRFGLDHSAPLLNAMLPWYGVANNRLLRDPANAALTQKLNELVSSPPGSALRTALARQGYDWLKAWLMMARPDRADAAFFAQTMKAVQPTHEGISTGLWQSLAPDLWAFWINALPHQPQWKIAPDETLVRQARQVLLQQMGHRNAESTLYENMLKSVRRNFADVTLEEMTSGTDARRLFTTDAVVPGMFTRQAWEGEIQQAIEKVVNSRREEIDWVLSDSRGEVAWGVSPEALKARLIRRYFTDFAGSWLSFLNSLRWNPARNIADVTDQLTLMSDVRQSPVIALMNTLAWQGQAGQQSAGLTDSVLKSAKELIGNRDKPAIDRGAAGPQGPLDETFGPLLSLMGKNKGGVMMSADSSLSLQTYLTRITRVRLRLQQVAGSADPQEMMQSLAQTVFRGKSIDLTDTQQYGSLVAASLGEEWSGFGRTMFVQPLSQAWETVLQPSAASLNARWSRSVAADWHTAFDGRYPFAAGKSDASLPMLAEFIRKDSGRIERFLKTELNGVLHKEGSRWVADSAHGQGLNFNPAFLRAVNQLSQLSDILFTDGSQGIGFELQARAVPEVVETQLTIDGQKLHYFNQAAEWQRFRWPGETFKPGTTLTWTSTSAGARLYGDYSGTWGLLRWLDQGRRQKVDRSQWMLSFRAPDGRRLEWVLRTQLGDGPLALLGLRGFRLPEEIFSVEAGAQALTNNEGITDMDGVE
jgi:type VI secretion system protein ImpL